MRIEAQSPRGRSSPLAGAQSCCVLVRSARQAKNAAGPRRARKARHAFTLVEVLAALLLMAIVIPVAMEGIGTTTRAGLLGQRKAAAMRVAERVLNELIVQGETQHSTANGTTADGDTNYPWTMRAESWSEDPMLHVTVTVTFRLQGNSYDVGVSTLLPQGGLALEPAAATTQ